MDWNTPEMKKDIERIKSFPFLMKIIYSNLNYLFALYKLENHNLTTQ